MNMLNTERKID